MKKVFLSLLISLIALTVSAQIQRAFLGCIYNHRTTKTNQKYPSVNL